MKTKLLTLFFLLSLTLFFNTVMTVMVQAAETQPSALAQKIICLDAEATAPEEHMAKIKNESGSYAEPSTDTYVMECVLTPQGRVCTTGNDTIDKQIGLARNSGGVRISNLSFLRQSVGYVFQGLFKGDNKTPQANPFKSDTQGNVGPMVLRSETVPATSRTYNALNFVKTISTRGREGGQQQGTFTFRAASDNCTMVRWDPAGVVFDSMSLEPVPGVTVTLTSQSGNTFIQFVDPKGFVQNPYGPTEGDGKYAFFVPTGVYRVDAKKADYEMFTNPADFSNASKMNPDYGMIYPVERGDAGKKAGQMYVKNDNINEEEGVVEYRDVPLRPLKEPYRATIVDVMERDESNGIGGYVVRWRVTHPLAQVEIYGKKPGDKETTLLAKKTADRLGWFSAQFENRDILIDEVRLFKPAFLEKAVMQPQTKNPILNVVSRVVQKIVGRVEAQQSQGNSIKVDPILRYIEGYAYDTAGKTMNNAKVGVYLTFSDSPYSTTATDENGFFRIASEYLPGIPYELRYTASTGQVVPEKTSQFIERNSSYLAQKKIPLNKYQDEQGKAPTLPETTTKPVDIDKGTQPGGGNGTETGTNPSGTRVQDTSQPDQQPSSGFTSLFAPGGTNSSMVLILLVILLLLGVVVALVVVGMIKKNSQNQPPQPPPFQ